LRALAEGARCTWFLATQDARTARKSWIAGHLSAQGELSVDAGAARALQAGSSLLPAGVVAVSGTFERGDAVDILGPGGVRLARGLAAYSHVDAAVLAGHRSEEFEALIGFRGRDEMVHRDDLVWLS
jgi:glutamate 5-kinase